MTKRRLGVAVLAACAAAAGTLAAASGPSPATARTVATLVPSSALYCEYDPCYPPHQFRVAYGIQPLLDSGIEPGRL